MSHTPRMSANKADAQDREQRAVHDDRGSSDDPRVTLTFDLGTSYLKAVAFDARQRVLAESRVPVRYDRAAGAWYELPIERFDAMLRQATERLAFDRDRITDLSFATQANTFACFDGADEPLTPLIVWCDQRADPAEVAELGALRQFHERTGMPDAFAQIMPAKARWLQRHEPSVWRATRRIRFIGDLLVWRLTGRDVCEGGYAGLSGLLDIHRMQWWPDACACVGIDPAMLGTPLYAGADLGGIRPEAAEALNLPEACRVTLGCLDQYAGAIGTGNTAPGGLSATIGTVLATVRCTERPVARDEIFVGPAWRKGLFFQMVFGNTSANLLEHYRASLPDAPDFEQLDRLAADAQVPSDLRLRPMSRRTKIEDCLADVRPHHTPGQVTRAILELVADAWSEQVDTLCGDERPERIHLAGGGARSPLWRSILGERVGRPVRQAECPEPTCLGAARLRGLGADRGDARPEL